MTKQAGLASLEMDAFFDALDTLAKEQLNGISFAEVVERALAYFS